MTPAIAFIALAVTGALVFLAAFAVVCATIVSAIDAADAETLSEARDEERAP